MLSSHSNNTTTVLSLIQVLIMTKHWIWNKYGDSKHIKGEIYSNFKKKYFIISNVCDRILMWVTSSTTNIDK